MALIDARKVPSSMMPLPQERSFSGSISGNRPYFDGPKSAACELSRNTPTDSITRLPRPSATSENDIAATSIHFVPMVTERLLK